MRMSSGRNAPPAAKADKQRPAKQQRATPKSEPAAAGKKSSAKTKPATTRGVPQPSSNESTSYNIRKIENGYIVNESRYDSKRGFISRDTFVPGKPVITINSTSKKTAG